MTAVRWKRKPVLGTITELIIGRKCLNYVGSGRFIISSHSLAEVIRRVYHDGVSIAGAGMAPGDLHFCNAVALGGVYFPQ